VALAVVPAHAGIHALPELPHAETNGHGSMDSRFRALLSGIIFRLKKDKIDVGLLQVDFAVVAGDTSPR
jgi:hypothetical protein